METKSVGSKTQHLLLSAACQSQVRAKIPHSTQTDTGIHFACEELQTIPMPQLLRPVFTFSRGLKASPDIFLEAAAKPGACGIV